MDNHQGCNDLLSDLNVLPQNVLIGESIMIGVPPRRGFHALQALRQVRIIHNDAAAFSDASLKDGIEVATLFRIEILRPNRVYEVQNLNSRKVEQARLRNQPPVVFKSTPDR